MAEFTHLLDALIAAERQIDILNISGGEPLMHPELLSLIDAALSHPEIVRVSISTNGLALLEQPELVEQLRERNVVVSLQFDGFNQLAYNVLRGRDLLEQKLEILDLLRESEICTSLTMTVAGGANDDQFPEVMAYYFAQPHIVSLMLQPLAYAGRGNSLSGKIQRLTIPDIVKLLASAGIPQVRAEDFLPLPCSHPLCFSLAFYLMLEGGDMIALGKLLDASKWLDMLANRTVFGLDADEQQRIKDLIYDLWSGPVGAAPDSAAVMQTLRNILDEMAAKQFNPRRAFSITERRIKSIFIHAFQDADTFDLARVRRCCNAYPQPDGRLAPACVHNVLGGRKKYCG
jgi:7,8-dihydro-6-hydroxymethylpterin dimethyltransferase